MTKAVLVDVDGVVIKKGTVFSLRLAKEKGLQIEKILPFFKGEFQDCLTGKKDLKEVLPKYLAEWGVVDSIEKILDFWFAGEAEVDHEVIAMIRDLRQMGIKCYLVTNNEKYRIQYLRDKVKFGEEFDGIFGSCDLGLKKPDARFFKEVLKRVGVDDPGKVEVWDDSEENINGAQEAGMKTKLWK